LFVRLTAVYGDARVSDEAQLGLLLREWCEAFAYHRPAQLHEAIGVCIRTCKFWPTIAEVFDALRASAPVPERVYSAAADDMAPRDFARDGRTQAEEIAYRAAFCLQMRKQYPAAFNGNYVAPEREPRPASDGGLSPALIELTKRQGIYRPAPTPNQQDSQ